MNNQIEQFARIYLSQAVIPLSAKYQHNKNIVLTLQLVDKGIIVGYQDVRIPVRHKNSIAMQYSDITFKDVTRVENPPENRIDDFINKMLGETPNTKAVEKINNQLHKTINIKSINFDVTYTHLVIAMQNITFQAEYIYFINSSLDAAKKKYHDKN